MTDDVFLVGAELLMVGTLGFALASITGTVFAGSLGNAILENQTASSNAQSERSFGRPGAGMPSQPTSSNNSRKSNSNPDFPDGDVPNMKSVMQSSRESQKVELDINAQPSDYLLLFITGYLVIILALILPSVSIMRYQPKEILAGKE